LGTEISKYQEERKSTETPLVVTSERGQATSVKPALVPTETPPLVRSRRELTLGRGSAELRSGTRQPLGLGAGGPSGPKGRGLRRSSGNPWHPPAPRTACPSGRQGAGRPTPSDLL